MRLKIRKIGNSWGVLLPRIIVKAYKKEDFIELIVKDMLYEETGGKNYIRGKGYENNRKSKKKHKKE